MENIMAEIEKDETPAKRTGTLNGEKNKPIHLPIKRPETSGKQTDSPALKRMKRRKSNRFILLKR